MSDLNPRAEPKADTRPPEFPGGQRAWLPLTSPDSTPASAPAVPNEQPREERPSAAATSTAVAYLKIFDHSTALSPQIAEQMIDLFTQGYKGRYPYQSLLAADTLIEGVRSGKYVFTVAFDKSDNLLGFAGISDFVWLGEETRTYGAVKEYGKLLVAEHARGAGVAGILTKESVDYALLQGNEVMVALAMTTHDHSQRALEKLGFRPTGITVCDWPNVLNDEQRESSVIMYRIESPTIRLNRPMYVPDSLRAATELALEATQCARTFMQRPPTVLASPGLPPSTNFEQESLSTQIFLADPTNVGMAIADGEATIGQGSLHVSITLDVGRPGSFAALERLVSQGYGFSSFHPLQHGDLITVQRVVNPPRSYATLIKCASEEIARLLNQITKFISCA